MKTLVILATLVVIVKAKTFTMKTRSTGSVRAKLIAEGTYSKYLEDLYRSRAEVLASGSQPFFDYSDDYYFGNITIGTPPQQMTVSIDTASADLWVVSASCVMQTCRGKANFDPTKSSTYNAISHSSTGSVGIDVFRFGGLTVQKQEFGLVNQFPPFGGPKEFDGIFGLGWPALSTYNIVPPMQNMLSQLDKPLFTVWMDRKLTPSHGGAAGLITYGAIDTTNCDSQINYVPLSSETYWQFTLSGFSIGSYSETKKDQVISDTGTSWIGCPRAVFQNIVQQTVAIYDATNQIYTVPCTKQNSLPDLVFSINGVNYNVPSVEYVLDLGLNNGQCVLTFFSEIQGGFGPNWILGDTWIRSYCQIYDIGGKQIGFAKAKHSMQ